MNQKCVATIQDVKDTLGDVVDGLGSLQDAIEDNDPDKVESALDSFPTPNALERCLNKLGHLISTRPWEKKERKKA